MRLSDVMTKLLAMDEGCEHCRRIIDAMELAGNEAVGHMREDHPGRVAFAVSMISDEHRAAIASMQKQCGE